MTDDVDDITQQLTRAAAQALRTARTAVERHKQRTARERDEQRREREHRQRMREGELRTAKLERQLAARQGNDLLKAELEEIEQRERVGDAIVRWSGSEALRDSDPELADAWDARLREHGIDPNEARDRADAPPDWDDDEFLTSATEQRVSDHAEDAIDQIDNSVVESLSETGDAEGAETTRLVKLAHPNLHQVGPTSATTARIPPSDLGVHIEHGAEL